MSYIQKYPRSTSEICCYSNTVGNYFVQCIVVHVGYVVFVQALQELVHHHIESFNFMVDEGLSYAVQVSVCSVNTHTITTLKFVYCSSIIVTKH